MHAMRMLLTLAAFLPVSANAMLPITVSLESEKSGLQSSTSGFDFVGVETFEGRATGTGKSFTTDFGGSSVFSGVYKNVQVNTNDQYGGAGGTGQYAVSFKSQGAYALDLSTTQPKGVTYFGFWLSALDKNNNVSFFQGKKQLFTFSAADAKAFIDGLPKSSSYYGNPNTAYQGKNTGEPYAFLNFYAKPGTSFDKVVFSQSGGGGYESDNHTVGVWNKMSGTIIPAPGIVPEPQNWAMLIAGFSLVGVSLRRRSLRRTRPISA